eukprot:572117-Amphidinium_carterae.1
MRRLNASGIKAVRTNSAFAVGELCIERRQVELPVNDDETPACVKLHGLLPAPQVPAVLTDEPALVNRAGVGTSVYCAEFLAVVRVLEECQPHEVVSNCKGVIKAVQVLQTGHRTPKGQGQKPGSRETSP